MDIQISRVLYMVYFNWQKEYNHEEAYEQIELFYSSLGSNVDEHNKGWYEKYLYKKNKAIEITGSK